MSSIVGACSLGPVAAAPTSGQRIGRVWPAAPRSALAGLTVLAALVLAVASGSEQACPDEASTALADLVIDPNSAPRAVLAVLPSAGPALAAQFVEARQNRPFASVDDAGRRVRGLGPSTLGQIAPYLK